jgi:hypothetical protein
VDTHADIHVAAACDHLGGVLGTESFPTTPTGYRRLLAFLVSFGPLASVGVEGTGSYGSGLARHLTDAGVHVVEVNRPNRQVRRRHGKSDTVDAIAAARAVISGQATAIPKTHDGSVEALRALQIVHRSAMKSRTQALNQLHALVITAPEPVRAQLRGLNRRQLLATCQAYRPGAGDDIVTVTKFALRHLAIRIDELTLESAAITKRRRRLLNQMRTQADGDHRRRPRHRDRAADRRRRQPRPARLTRLVRCAPGREPDRSIVGQDREDAPEPRR